MFMIRRGNLIFLWGLIASISGFFVLKFLLNNASDRIALTSFIFGTAATIYTLLEQRKSENYKSIKDTKDSILLELEDLKKYIISEVKEIKYSSKRNDDRHDNSILLLSQQVDALKLRFEHHIEESGHNYTTEELLKLKEQLETVKAIVKVEAKYADINLRLLNLEKMLKSTKEYRDTGKL